MSWVTHSQANVHALPAPDSPTSVLTPVAPLLGMCSVEAGGLLGLSFQKITVEVASRRGPSAFQLAGLAETAVREARIRLASALSQLGITLDEYALTVNLAPANVRKSGSGLDLAIALALLGAIGRIEAQQLTDSIFLGEVSLDGSVRPIPGILPLLDGARLSGIRVAFVPAENAQEAARVSGIEVYPVARLSQLIAHLDGRRPLSVLAPAALPPASSQLDLADVRGQAAAKRALMISAAGQHHLLLVGPPGSGKSLLARRLPSLLPELRIDEALETTAIHSVAGVLNSSVGIVSTPPFRAPHHTVSEVGLVGGGSTPRPGEISLAHHGVLFLDEMPEFRRGALEALRQPLEEHEVNIIRARFRTCFPARPLLVAAMNPCPCGNWGNPRAACRCTHGTRLRYLGRISGPLLDRIDLHVLVPPADLRNWKNGSTGDEQLSSSQLRARVTKARAIQEQRFLDEQVQARENSRLSLKELERVASPNREGQRLLNLAIEKNQLSARAYVRVLRIARTIADLDSQQHTSAEHIGEALRYRINDLADC